MGFDFPDDLRCVAINSGKGANGGKRCLRQRRRGDTLCEKHYRARPKAEIEGVKPSAPPAKVQAQVVEVAKSAGITVVDGEHLEPVEVMDWCVSQAAYITKQFMDRLKESPDITAEDMAPTVRATLEAIGHSRKAAEAAESAGMQRRRVVLEESKVRAAAQAMKRAILRMGLTDAEEARFVELVAEELAVAAAP